MYKCGWQGCEKAYGTLNHLNAHVTMQSHGQKRTPEGMTCLCLFNRETPIWVRSCILVALHAMVCLMVAVVSNGVQAKLGSAALLFFCEPH